MHTEAEIRRMNGIMLNALNDRDYIRVAALIREHPDWMPHFHGFLVSAVLADDVELAEHLIGLGLDVNAKLDRGETAFSYACAGNHFRMAKFLHQHGAEINTIDEGGGTPLDWAVQFSSQEFCEWLVSVGGKRNDLCGDTDV